MMMLARTTLFFDVDTQRDFMLPGGKLQAPGAARIIPMLAAVTQLARDRSVRIVGSADRHFPGDAELARNGGAYPDHCMDGTPGQCRIDETAPRNPLFVENRQMSEAELAAAIAHRGEVVIEKQEVDVFRGNRNTQWLLDAMLEHASDVVIYGVCTDICVDSVVRGMLRYRKRLHVVTGAIAALDHERAKACLEDWRDAGVDLITLDQLVSRLYS
jgi:nicotinamidase/pyrazinamidase